LLRRLEFDLWYLFRPPWDSGVSPPELLEFMAAHPAGRAIDLGCGTGTNVITLAQHGWQVTGLDYSARAIGIAERKLRRARLAAALSVCDVTRLPGIDGPFDLALDLGCFHGLRSRGAYLANLARILAPGGHWLMYGFFRHPSEGHGPGLMPADLALIESYGLRLLSRQDGTDRGERPSAWFLYERPAG
jgi:ubiquinone/menaquinone biosynthesis C-methylase UbiE